MGIVLRRGFAALLVVALAAASVVLPSVAGAPTANAQAGDIYTPPSPLPAGENGDVIKSAPATYSNATSTRVMYLSRDVNDQPMPVTGTVIVPNAPWTGPGERPVVAYAPFTNGMGDRCAVSKLLAGEVWADLASGVQQTFVNALLAQGFAVAQTDYEGLGTPSMHTYMNRASQAHAVLDVIRAAQRLPDTGLAPGGPVGIAGYSQGGGASAAAAELAPTYAPELDIQGVYAGATPADLSVLANSLDGSMYFAFLGFAMIGINAAYPDAGLLELANDQGVQMFGEASELCTLDAVFRYWFTQSSTLTVDGRRVADYVAEEPFRTILAENKLGNVAPTAPVLVEHSWIDDAVPNAQGKQMAKDWCARGANVQYRDLLTVIPLLTHLLEAGTAANNAANWLAGRFAGTAPTPNCGSF
jgi:hypothetical protein